MSASDAPVFQSPEDLAPGLGMTKTELRRYCKESGHFTRLSKNRIMLDHENVKDLIAWVKDRDKTPAVTPSGEIDHFA